MEGADTLRLAALADVHYGRGDRAAKRKLLTEASQACDVLLLCGDLTDHGRPAQARELAADVEANVDSRVLAVLGNHDHESDQGAEVVQILEEVGIQVLDGECVVIDGIGFAGVRGFAGGFDKRAVHAFGEPELKAFIRATIDEALKLETALSRLDTDKRVVLLHYAPIRTTVEGEPAEIIPFLGSSRLEDPLNHHEATVVFHGHAHKGSPEGHTSTGIPVYNVSVPVLEAAYPDRPAFRVHELDKSG